MVRANTVYTAVIAQLFRLSSSIFTLSDNPYNTIDIPSNITTDINPSDLTQIVAQLVSASQRQEVILLTLLAAQKEERHRYQNLGKPLGATFLMISVLFVLLGTSTYIVPLFIPCRGTAYLILLSFRFGAFSFSVTRKLPLPISSTFPDGQ